MARPTKLSPEVQAAVCEAIRAGNYARIAARLAGVSDDTVRRWLERGEREKSGAYAEFADAYRTAEAEAHARNVALIQQAALTGEWKAAAWWLERRFPKEWGATEKHELTGKDGGPIQTENKQKIMFGETEIVF